MFETPPLPEIQKKLASITNEMLELIHKYNLNTQSPFEVVAHARLCITNDEDYIRFLELSLEGRIYGDAGAAIEKAEASAHGNKAH